MNSVKQNTPCGERTATDIGEKFRSKLAENADIADSAKTFSGTLLLQENERLREEVKRLEALEHKLAQVGVVLLEYAEGDVENLYEKVHGVVYGK